MEKPVNAVLVQQIMSYGEFTRIRVCGAGGSAAIFLPSSVLTLRVLESILRPLARIDRAMTQLNDGVETPVGERSVFEGVLENVELWPAQVPLEQRRQVGTGFDRGHGCPPREQRTRRLTGPWSDLYDSGRRR